MKELRARRDGDRGRVRAGLAHEEPYTSRALGPDGDWSGDIELRLDTRTQDAWTVLEVGGEVDLSTAPALRDRLLDLIDDGATRLIVDLGDVGFIDSSGLGVLVQGLKRLRESGGDLELVIPDGPTIKVFAITGLDKVFAIHPTVAAAVRS